MPVLMTQKAMKSGEKYYEVMVDSTTACENVKRFSESQGYTVEITNKSGDFLLVISK